jgi:glycosyltransferase involved in cell wall biosynthesis/ribosomal protein S18 acetylase RimI-like enzyme
MKVAHLTTVDMSLRYLVLPQLLAVVEGGGEAVGISAPGPFVPELEELGIRHVPLASSTRGVSLAADLRAMFEFWRAIRRERPDVMHTHNPKPGIYGRILGRIAGVPIVVNTIHGLYATDDDPLMKRLIVYGLEAVASRFSDAELVQSPEDLELLRRLRITPRARTSLLGNGVDLTRFDPAAVDDRRHEKRIELGINEDEVLVGMVGRLVAEKGYPELFEATAQLDDRFRLVVIGPEDPTKADGLSSDMIASAKANGVIFLGMRTDMADLYSAMDLLVLPSHREGFPRAAMEAAATGLPVIATDIRGCRQVVEDGTNGILVPVRDGEALAEAIRRLGDDPEMMHRMGEASRSRAVEHFDEQRVVEKVMGAYRQVAERKGLAWKLEPPDRTLFIRPAQPPDAPAIAELHRQSIETGFLSSLGGRFLRLLYAAMIEWPGSAVFVVSDGSEGPLGFVAGVERTGAFYRHFLRTRWFRAGMTLLPRVIRPSFIRRVWETLRYGAGDDADVEGELLSMAVAPSLRGKGWGGRLGAAFLADLGGRGVKSAQVVVGAANGGAIAAYETMGFGDAQAIEVHRGDPSVVMTWRA